MKAYLKIFAIIFGVLIALFVIFLFATEGRDAWKRMPGIGDLTTWKPREAERTPTPVQASPQEQWEQANPQAVQVARYERIRSVTSSMNLRITNYNDGIEGILIELEWGGSNATLGADFLEEALRQGMARDFKHETLPPRIDNRGQRFFRARYLLIL